MFPGFPRDGLRFLQELAGHNTTAWFHANKARYATVVRAPMIALVEDINAELHRWAPAYVARLPGAVSRPNRDTRFSRDKSPYRTDISAVFPRAGLEKQQAAGFFFRIGSDGAELIGGAFMPGTAELARFRKWLLNEHRRFGRIVSAAPLHRVMGNLLGEQLQRVPKGLPPDHPAADLLRRKQFYLRRVLPASLISTPRLRTSLVESFKVMVPFVTALDEGLGNR